MLSAAPREVNEKPQAFAAMIGPALSAETRGVARSLIGPEFNAFGACVLSLLGTQ
jgi:hypothetical protein